MSGSKKSTPHPQEPAKNSFSDKLTKDPREHMEAMGAAKGKGQYSAMPPSQHRAFLDISQSQDNRVLAAVWERIIVPNSQDWTLAAFARESNERQTPSGVSDISAASGIAKGAVSESLQRWETRGVLSIQRKPFRIYLCYYVPKPNIDIREGKKERTNVLCTRDLNSQKLRYLERLQQDAPETFRAAISRLVGQKLYDRKRDADVVAWSRERGAEQWEQRFTEIGYTGTELRGRERLRPASNPEHFKPEQSFEEFYVQNEAEIRAASAPLSVQNGEIIVHEKKKNSAQNPHPYGLTLHSLTQEQLASQGRSNAQPETRQAELKPKAAEREAGTEIRNEISARLRRAGLKKLGAVEIDTGTIGNLTRHFQRLATAGEVRDVLDVLEERARELKTGKRVAEGWGYLVNVVKSECDKRDVRAAIKTAAAGKGWS